MMADDAARRAYLGRELARWREHRKLSYRELEKLVPYSWGHLWKVANGRANMTKDLALACDRALNTRGALVAALTKADEGYVPPAQLPIAPRLVGRNAELSALQAMGHARPAGMPLVVAIDGPAGVGKTALALRWAHEIAGDYLDGQLYADLRAFAPPGERVSAAAVLERFLTALGASSIPDSTVDRATLYRSLVVERKVLVVLDNVGDITDVEPLLPASADCTVVVTSRRNLSRLVARAAASRVTVRPLAERDAITLLSWVIGDTRVRAEAAAVATVARLCGYLPLVLQRAAELIATSPRRPVADLVDGLFEDDNRLGELRAVFSWSYQHLEAEAARVFRLLGLPRGPHLTVAAVAALAGLRRGHTRALLLRLASLHLVDLDAHDMVRLHDVLRIYARELATSADADTDRAAAVHRLASWYTAGLHAARRQLAHGAAPVSGGPAGYDELAFTDAETAKAWCQTEATNLRLTVALARDHGLPDAAAELATLLADPDLIDLAGDIDATPDCPLRTHVPAPRQYGGTRDGADPARLAQIGSDAGTSTLGGPNQAWIGLSRDASEELDEADEPEAAEDRSRPIRQALGAASSGPPGRLRGGQQCEIVAANK